jgi:hypothetical protein
VTVNEKVKRGLKKVKGWLNFETSEKACTISVTEDVETEDISSPEEGVIKESTRCLTLTCQWPNLKRRSMVG